MDPIFIKPSFRRIDLVHREILQRVHHIGCIPEKGSQCLPSPVAFEITLIVHSTRGIGIDVIGPHFPLDKQNGGVIDTTLVQHGEYCDFIRRVAFAEFTEGVEAGGSEGGGEF